MSRRKINTDGAEINEMEIKHKTDEEPMTLRTHQISQRWGTPELVNLEMRR